MSSVGALEPGPTATATSSVTLLLCGDVMTGRGIDQMLAHPSNPALHEPYVADAQEYVRLAERQHGAIPRPVADDYVWGDALAEIERSVPDLRIVNLETAVTTSGDFESRKDIHYRMNPENIGCLRAFGIDCCTLANNHVLDWGQAGLLETLDVLIEHGFAVAGAGRDLEQATRPAILSVPGKGRVLVYACGSRSAGIPASWAATAAGPGVFLIDESSTGGADQLASVVRKFKQPGDLAVLSIHWGPNWGYPITDAQQRFARAVIDRAGIDVVYGHSSHHIKAIEVIKNRLVLYGCGDFLNDYEGIGGYEEFRGDLGAMVFATVDLATSQLVKLDLAPLQSVRFRLTSPSSTDVAWLEKTLNRIGGALGTSVEPTGENRLTLRWR